MGYPAAPWQLHGQLWVSLFRVGKGDHPDRRPGVYGVALVSYETPSPLTYSELLVATARHRRVNISDIWVDSVDSRDGGRELWAIPKDLCDFSRTTTGGLLRHTEWQTSLEGTPICSARFADVSERTVRTPFRGGTWQTRPTVDGGPVEEVTADLSGSGKALPCRGHWDFSPEGPLGWLAGKRTLASFRMADFSMSFG